ncbi:PREDICTED: uncharacterized protein LOC108789401 [Nanorana parkeri]|uniref:uncharacterized protein LOC108789401 n=1 Tax=Nanorana parkeri TaxID=125878 RepID=UPI000854AB4B|nr:PREDICTED: uncharacterized protein LOC108789401 [Nanorana parkeri]
MLGVPPLELRLPQALPLMDKAKEDHILEVELSLVPHHTRTHLDPSRERQVPHLHLPVPIQEQHLGSSHLNQMCHIPTQGPPVDSNQMCHILQDPIQEPLLDSSLHQMLHTLQHPTQGLQLGQTRKQRMLLIQELLLAHNNQEPHLVHIQELLPAHNNQEPHLVHIQEPHLVHIQELLLAHNNQEPHLANQEHLGNIPILQGQWDLVACQGHILTLLVNHIRLHLALMVSLLLQVLHLVGQGGLGDPRVGSSPHSLICHIQLLLHSQFLVLMLHLPEPGARCRPVSGDHRHHFLELLDHTQIKAIPEVAGFQGSCSGSLSASLYSYRHSKIKQASSYRGRNVARPRAVLDKIAGSDRTGGDLEGLVQLVEEQCGQRAFTELPEGSLKAFKAPFSCSLGMEILTHTIPSERLGKTMKTFCTSLQYMHMRLPKFQQAPDIL